MVRIKERYLLVNILYPTELGNRDDVPDVVVLNQPTTEDLTPVLLLRAIRAEVAMLFGDYGSGALEGGGLSEMEDPAFTELFMSAGPCEKLRRKLFVARGGSSSKPKQGNP
ncbi:hypothetical protein GGS20DRAFT_584081 [Poronia punctata]|nr:hypothetical protein GGS20DRAFT_584081 [Poronia punctata]